MRRALFAFLAGCFAFFFCFRNIQLTELVPECHGDVFLPSFGL
jgi:hypothetical protein